MGKKNKITVPKKADIILRIEQEISAKQDDLVKRRHSASNARCYYIILLILNLRYVAMK